ncbi:peptidoglycan bridge formation glycyltransferase FemA/FemB family protein [bacterium]|nr:peptidoglycan bridge formation glycyltransferase FemA/FemB family protein [bacterium]
MMKFTQIDDENKWNAFIQASPGASILQGYEWGKVKSSSWKPFYTAVLDEDENILAAALILKRALPFVGRSIFYCPRGPIFKNQNSELISFLFTSISELAKKENAFVFRCDPEISENETEFVKNLRACGLRYNPENIQPRGTIILDVRPDADTLLKSFHHKTRYNIKLSEKKGVTIEEKNSQDGVDVFYKLFRITSERDKFLILQKSYFTHLWKTLSEKNMCSIFIACYDGKPLSAVFMTVFGKTMTYLYGASSNEYRNLMPNHLVHWHAIEWAKSRGVEYYDFWGIPSHPHEQHPLWGVYRFKKGFCETETNWIGTFELIFNSFWYVVFEKAAKWFKMGVRFLKTGKIKTSLEE